MTVGIERKSGPFGLIKHWEKVLPGKKHPLILRTETLGRLVEVIGVDEIFLIDYDIKDGCISMIQRLNKEKINQVNLKVSDKNGKLISLKWKR